MAKAHCDIYKRVVAECEHELGKGDLKACLRAIKQLRDYERELNKKELSGRRAR